jgi:glyoxylase-like metal-dependent hydrolase (beta-lactamase superfamily II)
VRPQKFGDILVQKIIELDRLAVDPNWLIGNATAPEIEAERHWLGDGLVEPSTGKLIIGVHSFLVRTPRRTILVDTCCGDRRDRGAASPFHMLQTSYLANLRAAGVEPEEIDLVFCTHLHVDHVGWNVVSRDGRWVPTFPNARYLFNPTDFEHRLEAERTGTGSPATRAAFREAVLPIVESGLATFVDCTHALEQEVDSTIRLISLPGHCPGHTGLTIAGGGRAGVVTGDAIHHPIQLSRPDWYCAADVDPLESTRTRQHLIDAYADTDTILLTAHFPGATAGRVVGTAAGACFAFL